jgi:hypothetical protein
MKILRIFNRKLDNTLDLIVSDKTFNELKQDHNNKTIYSHFLMLNSVLYITYISNVTTLSLYKIRNIND